LRSGRFQPSAEKAARSPLHILGNGPAVVRKHYGKLAKGHQANIDRLMFEHFQDSVGYNSSHRKVTR
jgi:hypothetical protein